MPRTGGCASFCKSLFGHWDSPYYVHPSIYIMMCLGYCSLGTSFSYATCPLQQCWDAAQQTPLISAEATGKTSRFSNFTSLSYAIQKRFELYF